MESHHTTHSYTRAHTNAHKHTQHAHIHTHTGIHTHAHTHTHTHTHIHIHTHICTHTDTFTHTHRHPHMHTDTHACMHTHTHTHTHIYHTVLSVPCGFIFVLLTLKTESLDGTFLFTQTFRTAYLSPTPSGQSLFFLKYWDVFEHAIIDSMMHLADTKPKLCFCTAGIGRSAFSGSSVCWFTSTIRKNKRHH